MKNPALSLSSAYLILTFIEISKHSLIDFKRNFKLEFGLIQNVSITMPILQLVQFLSTITGILLATICNYAEYLTLFVYKTTKYAELVFSVQLSNVKLLSHIK